MSVYTNISKESLAQLLERYAIGKLVEHTAISAGISNSNYYLDTDTGRFIFTIFEEIDSTTLPFYLSIHQALRPHRLPVAEIIADTSGNTIQLVENKPAVIASCLPGSTVKKSSVSLCTQLGSILAKIHLALTEHPHRLPHSRDLSWQETTYKKVKQHLTNEQIALISDELEVQKKQAYHELPQGIIHGDLFRDNVLAKEDTITGVIDFYFACYENLLWDVATTVNDWCIKQDGCLDTEKTEAFLSAYQAERPFTEAEHKLWPMCLRASALRYWLSRLYDFYFPQKGVTVLKKDPKHFENILCLRRR